MVRTIVVGCARIIEVKVVAAVPEYMPERLSIWLRGEAGGRSDGVQGYP